MLVTYQQIRSRCRDVHFYLSGLWLFFIIISVLKDIWKIQRMHQKLYQVFKGALMKSEL